MGILRTDRITGLGGANAITGSVRFHGNQDDLQLDPSSDFNFGTGDYTIEAWVYPVEFGRSQMIFAVHNADSTAAAGKFYFRSTNKFTYWSENAARITSSTTYTESKWYHVALVNNSGTQTIYVDGTSQGTATYGNGFGSDTFVVHIGRNAANDTQSMNGYISNIRVTKGTALYTSAFTPPTTRLIKRSDTVLLACNSASNVLNEETGKVIQSVTASTNNSGPQASKFTPNSPVGFSTTTDVGGQYGSTFDGFGSFATSTYMVPPGGNTRERGRGRGLAGGGWNNPSVLAQIYSVEIASDGTSADFGDLTLQRRGTGAAASHTRGVWAGGYAPGYQDRIDFVTIANSANAIDFGNLDTGRFESSGVGNDTRGVFGPCENPSVTQNVIQYITFATTGNATDFGDSTIDTGTKKQASMCSTTRGLFAGGQNVPSPLAYYDIIDKITIATTGNAADFGDLTQNVFMCTGVSDSTRGIRAGGAKSPSPANTDTIDFVTIASDGNALDFGNLTTANQRSAGMSNRTRGLFSGGATPNSSTSVNSIDKITIQTTGNAVDFGDFVVTVATQAAGCSDSHGGLS